MKHIMFITIIVMNPFYCMNISAVKVNDFEKTFASWVVVRMAVPGVSVYCGAAASSATDQVPLSRRTPTQVIWLRCPASIPTALSSAFGFSCIRYYIPVTCPSLWTRPLDKFFLSGTYSNRW